MSKQKSQRIKRKNNKNATYNKTNKISKEKFLND